MTQYVAPIKSKLPMSKRWCVGLASEKDSGTKHTHLAQAGGGYAFQKGPTDYLFTVSLIIQNVADGSRWRVEDTADNSEVASGVQSGTGNITVSGIGYSGSNRTLRVKVRKGSSGTKYLPFETNTIVGASGGSTYIIQVVDPIA
jgi:hypothetical protein